MEPNASTNKDDIIPQETKPNQPETPAWLLIAILVVAAGSAGASISFTLCSSYTLLFSLISGFAITLIPAVALAVVSKDAEFLAISIIALGAGSIGALISVLFLWSYVAPVVAISGFSIGVLSLLVRRLFGTSLSEVAVAYLIVLCIGWFLFWPRILDGVYLRASRPGAPPIQCKLIANKNAAVSVLPTDARI